MTTPSLHQHLHRPKSQYYKQLLQTIASRGSCICGNMQLNLVCRYHNFTIYLEKDCEGRVQFKITSIQTNYSIYEQMHQNAHVSPTNYTVLSCVPQFCMILLFDCFLLRLEHKSILIKTGLNTSPAKLGNNTTSFIYFNFV